MRSSSCEPNFFRRDSAADVAAQFLKLVIADADTPKYWPGDVFDLVRFVENHGGVFGNDAAS